MTARVRAGIAVTVIHVVIVASLGGKLLADRALSPRGWARTAPVDPNLPIRGRYVSLYLEALPGRGLQLPTETVQRLPNGTSHTVPARPVAVALVVRDGQIVAEPAPGGSNIFVTRAEHAGLAVARVNRPVAFFIPEHVADPSRRAPGEELWVEVSIPRRGPPRPIRLGVKKAGVLMPLAIR